MSALLSGYEYDPEVSFSVCQEILRGVSTGGTQAAFTRRAEGDGERDCSQEKRPMKQLPSDAGQSYSPYLSVLWETHAQIKLVRVLIAQ